MRLSRRILVNGLTALLLLGVISGLDPSLPAAAQVENRQASVDSKVLESLRGGKSADFIIVMAEQADLSAAYGMADWDERGWYVYNTLKETAARTQKRSLAELKRRGVRAESFFAGNEIYVHAGSEQALNAILALGDAGSVRAPVTVQLEPAAPRFLQSIGPVRPGAALQAETQSIVDWGITDTGAPTFWSAYGRQGQGIIVANIDTGVQYNHPALATAYRCAEGSLPSAACWHDAAYSTPSIYPYDDQGHGTHTMGTMVGSNEPSLSYTVGMAPSANWIACKAFIGNDASNEDLAECADWILAPGGSPSNRPHIVNNSWGGAVHDPWFKSWVNAWAAAGIFPVFSAGNSGSPSTCSNIYSPGDYPESFTVAAHDSSRNIASFSSKGPLTYFYGELPYLKPNISAPGVSVMSAYPTPKGTWVAMSGTSMAAPHVAGAVALLWSCNPALVGQVDQTRVILQDSAYPSPIGSCPNPTGIDGDSTYGHGYLNVYSAGVGRCIDWIKTYLPLITNKYNSSVPPDPILNGDFESGRVAWTEYSKNGFYIITNPSEENNLIIHNGYWAAWLGGAHNEIAYLSQTVGVPVGRSILHYWFLSSSSDTCGNDTFTIKVNEGVFYSESVCTSSATGQWVERTADLSSYAGTSITIKYYMSTNASGLSNVFLDDISLETSAALSSVNNITLVSTIDPGLTKSNPQP